MKPQELPFRQKHSFAAKFIFTAIENPTLPALITEDFVVSYSQLLIGSIAIAKKLKLEGVNRASTIALNAGDPVVSISFLIATSLLGCRLVTAGAILAKHKVVQPTHFYKTPEAKGKQGVHFREIDKSWFLKIEDIRLSDLSGFEGYSSADDVWLILHTSGTTGRPKFMGLTHRIVADRTSAIEKDFPKASLTAVLLFKPTTRPYFARVIGALVNACTIVDSVDCTFWRKVGVNAVFCSPSQFETFRRRYGVSGRFRRIEISGAKLEDDQARILANHFNEIIDIYGASETNKTFANLVTVTSDGTITRKGQPLDSEVEILDANNEPLGPGVIGHVRVRNKYMIHGYIDDQKSTERNFKDGWFFPGDLARWGEKGNLEIVGRDDDIISFGGIKIDARLIDAILQSIDNVEDAICIKSPKKSRNEVIAFVVFADGANKAYCVEQMRQAYRDHTGLPCFLGPIHEIDRIPYNDDGRPMRQACEELLLKRISQSDLVD